MTELRILLATPHAGFEQRIRQAFGPALNGELRRWSFDPQGRAASDVVEQLGHPAPDVVAIGPDLDLAEALALAERLERERPEITVLLVHEPGPELWQQALRAGVRDVLAPDAPDLEVRAAFERAMDLASRRRENLVGAAGGAPGGRIITVLSPKGGSGKTTVASNLAVGLASAEPDGVVIVDLDLQFGDVATALGLTPQFTLVDAVRTSVPLDGLTLKSYLSSHRQELWALCGPDSPADGEEVSPDQTKQVISLLAQEFAYVVLDTSAGLDEHTLAALEISTDLVFVCALDVTSIRSMRKEIAALDQLGMTTQRRHLVINRADSKVGLELRDVEGTLGLPVDVALGSSRIVPLSLNQGTPVIAAEPRSPIARQLGELVGRFVEQPALQAQTRRWRRSVP